MFGGILVAGLRFVKCLVERTAPPPSRNTPVFFFHLSIFCEKIGYNASRVCFFKKTRTRRERNMEDIQVVGSEDFDAVTQSGVVLVDFFASWCRPCRMQTPILEQIAPDFEGRAKIVKVDTDQSQDIAVKFDIQSIPTLFILKNGAKVEQFVGTQQAETLRAALERAIG